MRFNHKITSIYFAEDWVDSWYDHDYGVIVTTWFDLTTTKHYRISYLKQLEAAKEFTPRALIIDTSKAFGLPHPEDHHWLAEKVFPEVQKLKFKFIINIFPRNSIAKAGVKSIIDRSMLSSIKVLQLPSVEEAYSFLARHQD